MSTLAMIRILELLDLFADELEAGQGLEHLHAEGRSDLVAEAGGHDGLHRRAVGRQLALLLLGGQDVVQHQKKKSLYLLRKCPKIITQ